MERSVPSKRHKTFFSGSNSERRAFRNSHLGPLEVLTTVQRERIVERLKGFVLQWKREADVFPEIGYTFDVLLPEVGEVCACVRACVHACVCICNACVDKVVQLT